MHYGSSRSNASVIFNIPNNATFYDTAHHTKTHSILPTDPVEYFIQKKIIYDLKIRN